MRDSLRRVLIVSLFATIPSTQFFVKLTHASPGNVKKFTDKHYHHHTIRSINPTKYWKAALDNIVLAPPEP